ncbi:prefoldin subunit alpha [Candidatus Woesearchaeota archaeon]|jgi:prefoldin alpha subunit|nr:prefoldin subunit alpha [Candidatus Woesearchaeota archaeon]MBT6023229.1 prefoldin subunit alpha [Candidatus Woesearchaeota archaeon]
MDKQMEFQMLQQQMQKHQTDMQHFQRQKLEVEHLVETIKNLNKGEKVFTPIGAGIYYNAKITDNLKFMVNVGSGNFVEKTKPEIQKLITERTKNLDKAEKQTVQNLNKIQARIIEIQTKLQSEIMQENK